MLARVGVESAGHYHRTLVGRLQAGGYEAVEPSPRAVKGARSQELLVVCRRLEFVDSSSLLIGEVNRGALAHVSTHNTAFQAAVAIGRI